MDTSNDFHRDWAQTQVLKGGTSVPLKEIKPHTWMYLIEDIYRDFRLEYAPQLFRTLGEYVGKKPPRVSPFVSDLIPHGRITFEPGIGINTSVYLSPIRDLGEGSDPNDEIGTEENLLLLRPEEGKPLRFALWKTRFHMNRASSPIEKTFLDSTVRFVSREEVLRLFAKDSGPAYFFVHVGVTLRNMAEKMVQHALGLTILAESVLAIERRISTER